jgi:hypothetical protein
MTKSNRAEPASGRNEVPVKAWTLVLGASLALGAFGGTASALFLHPSQASERRAEVSRAGPSGAGLTRGAESVRRNCTTVPHACGFPDSTDTGVPGGTALRSVPRQVSRGPGWQYNAKYGGVIVSRRGTVLSGLDIHGNLDIEASDVTVKDVRVVTGGPFGISVRHTRGVTIENSTIRGQNPARGRVGSAIDDVYGDSTGMVIQNNDISCFKTAIQLSAGLIAGNYIHHPGYIAGDHTNGIMAVGSTKPLTIYGNTVFNDLGQTDAITLDASRSGQAVANKTVVDNLIAGGAYSIYGGDGHNDPTSDIVIEGNVFGRTYFRRGGQYGPIAYFNPAGRGNVWSGNAWAGPSPGIAGKLIPS